MDTPTLFDGAPPDPPAAPRVRIRLDVAYHGGGFHGFAENVGVRTVAGVLRLALERILGHRVALTGAGRTDRGVHAVGQVVSFDADPRRFDPDRLVRALNGLCAPDVAVTAAAVVDDGFDARASAVTRRYAYTVLNRARPDPLLADRTWHVAHPLELRAMRAATDPLRGEHDFSSFCRRPKGRPCASLRRHVRRIDWRTGTGDRFVLDIEADAFCHQMVRSVTGLLVAVGAGRLRAGDVHAVVAARDRAAVSQVAPPQGLVLCEVTYPDRYDP